MNNLILAADVLKSIQLLRFQSNMRVLSLVSRDTAFREVFTANFFVDGVKLGFLGEFCPILADLYVFKEYERIY